MGEGDSISRVALSRPLLGRSRLIGTTGVGVVEEAGPDASRASMGAFSSSVRMGAKY